MGKAIVTYVEQAIETFRLIDYIFLTYFIVIILWIIKLTVNYLRTRSAHARAQELHKATNANNTERIMKLLSIDTSGINVAIGDDGYTPFLRACYNGNTEVVKAMLQLGADIRAETARMENGFYLAAYNRVRNISSKDATCIRELAHAGVDINATNSHGISALQLAAMFGHVRLVHWLLNKNVNTQCIPSAYGIAMRNGFIETANFLKSHYIRNI